MDKKKIILLVIIGIIAILIPIGVYLYSQNEGKPIEVFVTTDNGYKSNIIKEVNQKENNNYLISPYSIEMALSMLKEGADGNTKTQISDLIGNRTINNVKLDNRINVANAVFIKNETKDLIFPEYSQKLKEKYDAELLYDDYKTYKPINEWVNKQTKGMIPKLNKDNEAALFDLLLANAVAIDIDWASNFKCELTTSEEFTKQDGSKENVSMMHNTYISKESAKYFDILDAKGVIIPYQSYDESGNEVFEGGNNLEFIGILPNVDIKTYLSNITDKTFADIDNNSKDLEGTRLQVALPRFAYDYNYKEIKEGLKDLGIEDVFISDKADLTKMLKNNGYVSEIIHKTHIDLNEKGTKAAAITAIAVKSAGMAEVEDSEAIKIEFNKPFAYIIRDKKTKEMLFFGVVYEPTKWNGSTCEKK